MINRLTFIAAVTVALSAATVPLPYAIASQESPVAVVESSPKIQIEAQYCIISDENLKKLNMTVAGQPGDSGPFTRNALSPEGNRLFSKLVKQGKIKIVTAPRLVAKNTEKAELRSFTSTPVILRNVAPGTPATGGMPFLLPDEAFGAGTNSSFEQAVVYTSIGIGVTATPTLTSSNTLDLEVALGRRFQVSIPYRGSQTPPPEQKVVDRDLDGIQFLENVKFGETIALVSNSEDLINFFSHSKANPANTKLLVVLNAQSLTPGPSR